STANGAQDLLDSLAAQPEAQRAVAALPIVTGA
ncbi:MAG: hypothetical protein QOF58_7365, partial [Pseudonocardiales bacterium]|nr:hypothetical protein [Pseudonocardiales bacterium]